MRKIVICLSCLFVGAIAIGQNSVNTAGGDVKNNSGSITYSIGQIAIASSSSSNGSVSQGVQYAYEIETLELEETQFHFSLNVFPNPTKDQLNLTVGNFHQENLTYKLVNSEGMLLKTVPVISEVTQIEMQLLPIATYFVEIHHENKKVQTFKIIKN